jgi:hypothetical protein
MVRPQYLRSPASSGHASAYGSVRLPSQQVTLVSGGAADSWRDGSDFQSTNQPRSTAITLSESDPCSLRHRCLEVKGCQSLSCCGCECRWSVPEGVAVGALLLQALRVAAVRVRLEQLHRVLVLLPGSRVECEHQSPMTQDTHSLVMCHSTMAITTCPEPVMHTKTRYPRQRQGT